MSGTKDWIEDCTSIFRSAEDAKSLLNHGSSILGCQYIPEVIRAVWPEFQACMDKLAPNDKGKTVVAVDLPAVFYASFEKNCDELESVPRDVRDRVASLYEDTAAESKERFLLAIDSPKLWRKEKFAGYKSSRKEKPEGFVETFQETVQSLKDCGYMVLQYDAHESDDILASVSFRAKLRRQNAVLVTDDRDAWQCLGKGAVMYSPRTGNYTKDDKLYAEHGIKPQQVVDYLCLLGKNDVPCAKGVGKKRAAEYLGVYGNFWGVFDFRAKLPPKIAESIEEFAKSDYWLARELHTLNKRLEVWW